MCVNIAVIVAVGYDPHLHVISVHILDWGGYTDTWMISSSEMLTKRGYTLCKFHYSIRTPHAIIPVARWGSRGSVEPPFRVTGSKYFSHTPHITSGISSSVQSC